MRPRAAPSSSMLNIKDMNRNILREGHPLQGDQHCYLMHHLYDHKYLSLDKILSIEQIWYELSVCHQYREVLDQDSPAGPE